MRCLTAILTPAMNNSSSFSLKKINLLVLTNEQYSRGNQMIQKKLFIMDKNMNKKLLS